jgi:hypothetical protein
MSEFQNYDLQDFADYEEPATVNFILIIRAAFSRLLGLADDSILLKELSYISSKSS